MRLISGILLAVMHLRKNVVKDLILSILYEEKYILTLLALEPNNLFTLVRDCSTFSGVVTDKALAVFSPSSSIILFTYRSGKSSLINSDLNSASDSNRAVIVAIIVRSLQILSGNSYL